jgi:hypothetical protein
MAAAALGAAAVEEEEATTRAHGVRGLNVPMVVAAVAAIVHQTSRKSFGVARID